MNHQNLIKKLNVEIYYSPFKLREKKKKEITKSERNTKFTDKEIDNK